LFSVNQTFEASVFEVPNPFFAALGQCASIPGAPGAIRLVACANKVEQQSIETVDMTMDRSMMTLS
jgi:hypothetical protein